MFIDIFLFTLEPYFLGSLFFPTLFGMFVYYVYKYICLHVTTTMKYPVRKVNVSYSKRLS